MADALKLPTKHRTALDRFVGSIADALQANLHSLVVYGSAVRGGFDPASSDINVLIVLEASTPEAHSIIAEALERAPVLVEPFILMRGGIERSFRAFAPKFDSIKRHYLVLHGADPLENYTRDADLAAFLLEQALRNLRLRSVQAYVHHRSSPRDYAAYLTRTIPVIMTDLSEVLRFDDQEIPNDFTERVPMLASTFGVAESGLSRLLDLGLHPRPLDRKAVEETHRFLFGLLDRAVHTASNR